MRKLTFVSLMVVLLSSAGAMAAKRYGAAGCGLGSTAFSDNGKFSQVMAATTNGTSNSQMFGITSGTSNCVQDGAVAQNMAVPMFVEANQDALAKDIARGSGETLVSFSSVLGCSKAEVLGQKLQAQYGRIYAPEVNGSISNRILDVVKNDQELAQDCKNNG